MTLEITEIRVTYGNGLKKEEYGALKKAEASFTIVTQPGQRGEDLLDLGFDLAFRKVNEMLGITPVADKPVAAAIVTGPQVAEQLAATEAKERKTRAKKTETPAVDPAAIVDTQPDPSAIVDDAAVVEEPLMLEDVIALPDESVVVDEDWNVTDVAPDITDLDMGNATTKRNGELGDPKLIRDLIATFNPDPSKPAFQLRQIPQAQRQDYLDKLAALKKA